MTAVTTGNGNTAVGHTAGDAIKTGKLNTVMGDNSGGAITNGENNVLIGANAGTGNLGTTKKSIIGGISNTLIGTGTAVNLPGATNRTVIGKGAIGKENNSVTLGNSSVTAVYASDDSEATIYAGGLNIGGTAVTSTAAELNLLDGASAGSNTTFGSGVLANVVEGSSTGNENVAIGYNALANNTTGYENTVVGYEAGYNATNSAIMVDKPRVTAIGFKAGKSNKGGNNTFIGHSANKQASSQSGSNATAIGYQATVAGSNAIQLGNSSVTSLTVGDGSANVTIYAGSIAQASDERLKKLIKPLVSYGLSYINKLSLYR